MEALLPWTKEAHRVVVTLRLHGRSQIRSTFILVLERYAQKLQAMSGKIGAYGIDDDFIKTVCDQIIMKEV